jgi:hypothetical protein
MCGLFRRLAVLGLACSFLAGCNNNSKSVVVDPSLASISGKFTFSSAPPFLAMFVKVRLHPITGGSDIPLVIKADGSFSAVNIKPGEMKVVVDIQGPPGYDDLVKRSRTTNDPRIQEQLAKMRQEMRDQPGLGGEIPQVAEKYTAPETTPLTWTITAGVNEPKEFDVSSS